MPVRLLIVLMCGLSPLVTAHAEGTASDKLPLSSARFESNVVPEPMTLALGGAGLLGLSLLLRRRRK
jgi:hypothetical protein